MKKQYDMILFICSMIIIFSSLVLLRDMDIIIYISVVFLVSFFVTLLLQIIYSKKLIRILDEECNPSKFIDEYRSFYKIKSDNVNSFHAINMCAGFVCSGRYEEAIKFLERIDVNRVHNVLLKMVYYINFVAIYIELDDLDKALEYLKEIDNIKLNKKINSLIENSININKIELNLKQGNISESRKLLNHLVGVKQSKRQYLEVMFLNVVLNIKENKLESVKEDLEKIIELGNSLYIVSKAKAELKKLE